MPPVPSQITVTIEGPQGTGKSHIAELIQHALLDAGISVKPDPEHGAFMPTDMLRRTSTIGQRVTIVERQDTSSIAKLGIEIDSSQVRIATDDITKLTAAAEKAVSTFKQLGEFFRGRVA